jgi:predicted ATPase
MSPLLDQMEGLARQNRVLMLFVDPHWAGAASLEVLDLAFGRLRRLPIVLRMTYRPEFQSPWKGVPDIATLMLAP